MPRSYEWGILIIPLTPGQDHLRHIFIDCHLDDSSELPALEAEPLNISSMSSRGS